jgi:hypothetical protein
MDSEVSKKGIIKFCWREEGLRKRKRGRSEET